MCPSMQICHSASIVKVTVSVLGRSHAFYLAHQLHRRRYLDRLITTYPKFEVVKYGIPKARTVSLRRIEAATRAWLAAPERLKTDTDLEFHLHECFDRAAEKHVLPGISLFVGWSGFSERGLLRARKQGACTILERGSAHIESQRDILREEYEKYGVRARLPNARIVEKEMREYEMADYISTPSSFVRRTFVSKGFPKAKLLQTPLGVDLSEFQPRPKSDGVFRVVYAGRLELQKGVQYLLQAFAELRLRDAELWLIGSRLDELTPFLDRYRGSYIHIDHVPQPKLCEYYSQCSVFVLPSVHDGFGMVLPQAMACGLPVICTANTAGEDLVTNGVEGFVIPIRDIAALKDKLLYLYENQGICGEMGISALERVARGLTWDDYGQRVCQQYSRILQEKGCL